MTSFDLSYLLRHGAVQENLSIQEDGYVPVSEILNHKLFKHCTFHDLEKIVQIDKKNRFSLIQKDEKHWIRANQGHSKEVAAKLKDECFLRKLDVPIQNCFHGTYLRNIKFIKKEGLRSMNRKHIHFATSLHAKSGKRYDCDVLVYIDMIKAMKNGIDFYQSENGVILTSGNNGILEPQYFDMILIYDQMTQSWKKDI